MKNAMDTTHEITKLIKFSPRREAIFRNLKLQNDSLQDIHSAGLRVLCPTRWTVRASSLLSIIDNYSTLLDTWEEALEATTDTEAKARINGVNAQMPFLFGTILGEMLLRHTDNLRMALQHKTMSAAEGQQVAAMVVRTIESLRDDVSFNLFWSKVGQIAKENDIPEPQIPQRPRRYDDGLSEGQAVHTDVRCYFRQQYYEAIDLVINSVQTRFNQKDYTMYCNLEQLLIKACQQVDFTNELQTVCAFYKDDVNNELLKAQLLTFGIEFQRLSETHCTSLSIFHIKEFFQSLSPAQTQLLSEVSVIMKLILVMPATNCTSERSFSALRRVKNYLRSSMTQQRLNNLMVLHVHYYRPA